MDAAPVARATHRGLCPGLAMVFCDVAPLCGSAWQIALNQIRKLLEMFGCGTAAVIAPIASVTFDGTEYQAADSPGPWAQRLYKELTDIQYGRAEGPAGWSVLC